MRIFIILAVAVMGLIGCAKAPELHAVGIYEGHQLTTKPWPGTTSMNVAVDVDRPKKSVTLVLGSYDPVQWDISKHKRTEINKIILIGYGAGKASVEINGDIYTDVIRQRDVSAAFQLQGVRFRNLVSTVPESLGFERLNSFHGSYRAPEKGFLISDIQTDNASLDPDYLKHKIQTVSSKTKLRLSGVVAGQSGDFLPDGTFVSALDLTPAYNLTLSTDHQTGYMYTRKGIRKIFADNDDYDFEFIPLPDRALRLGHFKAISFDEKRNQLLTIFQAGAGESAIMALDLETRRWSKIGSTGRNEPQSLFYDTANDRFLVSVNNFSQGISIGTLDPVNGQFQVLQKLNANTLDGFNDLYDVGNGPAPYLYIVGANGQKIVLATDGTDIFSISKSGPGPFRRIYTLDLKTGDSKLTYYD